MKTFRQHITEALTISQTKFGTNTPEFNDGVIATDSSQDLLMKFFGIRRNFHFTMLKVDDYYIMVGLGARDGNKTHRLVFGISKKPTADWKKYKYGRQPGVRISPTKLYGMVGHVAIEMIGSFDVERIVFNGYTERLSNLFQKLFASRDMKNIIRSNGFTVGFKDNWVILEK